MQLQKPAADAKLLQAWETHNPGVIERQLAYIEGNQVRWPRNGRFGQLKPTTMRQETAEYGV